MSLTVYELNEKIRTAKKAQDKLEQIKKEYLTEILSVCKEKMDKEDMDKIRNAVNQCIVLLNDCDTELGNYHTLLKNITYDVRVEVPYL